MILDPINDRACLDALTAQVRQRVDPSTKARCTPRWVVSYSRPKPAV